MPKTRPIAKPIRRWTLSIAFAGLAALLALPAHADIVVGIAGPMSGTFEVFGNQMKQGAEAAIRDINAAGGVLGQNLVLEVADDACEPKKGVAIANQMAGRGIAVMIGHFCSATSVPAAPVYAEARIVQITPSAGNAKFTDERAGPGAFRLAARDDQQGLVAAAYIAAKFAGKRIAILDDGSNYGKGLADRTRLGLNEAGVKEVLNETYTPGEQDLTPLAAKLRAAGIDVVYVGGYHNDAGQLARAMHDQGMATVLFSGDAIVTDEFWQAAGDGGNGSLMTFHPDPRKNPEAADLVARLRADGIEPEGYVLPTYAALRLWADAAIEAGSIDFDAVVAVLGSDTFATVLGPVSFDAKGDSSLPGYVVYRWRNGRYDYAM